MYIVLPFGISSAPHKFTKLLKPILAHLCSRGIVIITYLDDGWTIAKFFDLCFQNIFAIMSFFHTYRFLDKCQEIIPFTVNTCQVIRFQH